VLKITPLSREHDRAAFDSRDFYVHYGFVSPGQDMPLFLPLKTLRASIKVK